MTARLRLPVEALLALAVVLGGLVSLTQLIGNGRLPQPFVSDSWDTFMDWFHPAYWAHGTIAYTYYHSVYPPLSFVLLRLVGVSACYAQGALQARACDPVAPFLIVGSYLIAAGLAAWAFRRRDPQSAPWRGIAFGLGLPLLFALERGNLILLCLPFFIAGFGGLARGERGRAICAALALNFKPYLLIAWSAWIVRREWSLLKLTALIGLCIYLATLLLFGSGNPGQLVFNTIGFARLAQPLVWEQGLYSTSLTPFPGFAAVLPDAVTRWFGLIPFAVGATWLLVLGVLAVALARAERVADSRLALLLLGAYMVAQSPGGYTYAFPVFLALLERGTRPGQLVAVASAYLLCIPCDLVLGASLPSVTWHSQSWLTGATVTNTFGVSVGMFARPLLLIVLTWAMALDTLAGLLRWHASAPDPAYA